MNRWKKFGKWIAALHLRIFPSNGFAICWRNKGIPLTLLYRTTRRAIESVRATQTTNFKQRKKNTVMKNKLSHLMKFALCGLSVATALGILQPLEALAETGEGAVFAMTNRARNNQVVAFTRAADGTLTEVGAVSTRGNGIGVDFDTQGGLTLSADHRFLYACNPGSDDVTVFAVNGARLTRIQNAPAGDQPLSITFSGNLAYVLDGSVAGNGVTGFTLDPSIGAYVITHPKIVMPSHGSIYSTNEAYADTFPEPYRRYLAHLRSGATGRTYSSRYIGSLVADFHRTLLKGGIFLYPPTQAHASGKLRLLYEANPIAFLAEQAQGEATDGQHRILEKPVESLHQRTPLVVGSKEEMRLLREFLAKG